jgi:amino acid transporter
VNEEVKHRRENSGRAAIMAVAFLAILFVLCQISLQGAVLPAQLQANAPSALVYTATAIGGGAWAKVMALALALSVTASTNCGIVLTARMIYGMASHRVLPPFLANVSRRFATPVAASVAVGVVLIAVTWLYLLTTSVAGAFDNVIAVTGLLYATFYILTAMAAIAYYRRRIFSGAWNAITLGILPVAAAGFLGWVLVQSLRTAPAPQLWSLAGIVAGGAILMLCARLILKASFFQLRRETESQSQEP